MDLKDLLSKNKVLVIGDVILDNYIYGKVHRISPEAPVPVVLKNKSNYCLGGSANVAQNVSSFGSTCYLIGVCGDDQSANTLSNLMEEKNIIPSLIKDPSRPTTEKTRIIGNNHQIARIDSESTLAVSADVQAEIISEFLNVIDDVDGVVIQDYGKGMLTETLLSKIFHECKERNIPTITDPKERDFTKYAGSSWIKPNLTEFKNALDVPLTSDLKLSEIESKASSMLNTFGFDGVLLTMSEMGMLLKTSNYMESVDGIKIEVTDVSGAGDTVSAVFILSLLSGVSLKDCLRISNLSGSIVCQISGAVPVDPNILLNSIASNGWSIMCDSGNLISV